MTREGLERTVLALLDKTGTAGKADRAGRSFQPDDLVARVARAQRVGEADVRAALWRLIDRKDIRLTVDLELASARRPAARRVTGRARRS